MSPTLFWILLATLATSFSCSILEAVFLSISHSHIAVLKNRGDWAGKWLEAAQKNIDEPIAAILTLNTIANTMGATMAGAEAQRLWGAWWLTAFSAGLTFVVLLFAEIVPKTLGATYWKQLSTPSAYVLRAMVFVMKPVIRPLGWLARLLTANSDQSIISRAELEVLAEIGRREGAIDEDEWKVVSNVMRLDEVSVGEVMTPRTDMIAIPVSATVLEAQEMMLETGHLRLPVYQDSLDKVLGVVIGRDIWRAHLDGLDRLEDVMRPIPFAPASKAVEDLIPEMRGQRTKMVVVVDEFGGTAGLVTLEDLIEEIIGEIQDEHEGDEPINFHPLFGGRLRIWGGTSLREAAARLRFQPTAEEEDGFDTLGGLVLGRLNRIPVVGDQVELDAGKLRVTHMRGRRIEYLLYVPEGAPEHGTRASAIGPA
ncbi:MAG: hemolysin family protein [Gemmatimonadota bacterium]|nr:hemolysin family protein [Gemmatimonadota bacterium]